MAACRRRPPEAQQRAAARAQARRARGPADGPEDRALNERCLNWSVAGPPMLPGVYNNNVQIIQTRDYVVIVAEMIHDARIVPMDGRAHGTVPRWMGDSRGRWDGRDAGRRHRRLHRQDRRSADRASICIWSSASRASTPTRSNTASPPRIRRPGRGRSPAMFPMKKTAGPIYEYACHEGNARSMIGMLRGARGRRSRRERFRSARLLRSRARISLRVRPIRRVGHADADARLDVPALPRAIDDREQLVRLLAARREGVERSEVVVLLGRQRPARREVVGDAATPARTRGSSSPS